MTTNITSAPYVFRSNVVAERFVEHRKNLVCFKKLRIELNDIGKTVQSFFAKTTCGLIANPFDLSKMDLRELPRYTTAPTQADADKHADAFIQQRNTAVATFRETLKAKIAECVKGVTRDVISSEFASHEDDFRELVPVEERREMMNMLSHYALKQYAEALKFNTQTNPSNQMEDEFRAHYATEAPLLFQDERLDPAFMEAMNHMNPRVSEILIGRAAGAHGITPEAICNQCVLSFRHARQQIFYQALRESPLLRSQVGSRAPAFFAQYDADFDAIFTEIREKDDTCPLQDSLMEAHRMTKVRPPRGFNSTPASLKEFADKLELRSDSPLLLSKMAVHAIGELQNIYRRNPQHQSGANAHAAPASDTPSNSQAGQTSRAILDELFVSDQKAINEFGVDFRDALFEIVKKHQVKFRSVLNLPKSTSTQDIADSLGKPYMEQLLKHFSNFRLSARKWYPTEMVLRIAYGLAAPEVIERSDLRNRPMADLNKFLNERTQLGLCEKEAKEWVLLNEPDLAIHYQ